ncbi:helix-turn-helix transcriptional regulator [Oribacterium sp. NK2B42]|uniref:helix-turn-helix transcriptional regulator n=1 Tax=Oribacterium sp. NK2B42 TaxID=689781 RepID=UPI00041FF646|nr:helix-turn-helix domain-containing protein [Oribacterium sp. NK2B42]
MKDLIYSNRVYELRRDLGISQDRMAADLDISRRTISKIENGEQNPSLDMVYRIAAYFNRMIPDVFPLAKEIHLASFEEYSKK